MKKLEEERVCVLLDPLVTILPQDLGEPPAWGFPLPGGQIFWVDRDVFNALIARLYENPCDICPEEIKKRCDEVAHGSIK